MSLHLFGNVMLPHPLDPKLQVALPDDAVTNDHTLEEPALDEGPGVDEIEDGPSDDMLQTLVLNVDGNVELDRVREDVVLANIGGGSTGETTELVTVVVVDSVNALEGGCADGVGMDVDDGLGPRDTVVVAITVVIVHRELAVESDGEVGVFERLEPTLVCADDGPLVEVAVDVLTKVCVAELPLLGKGPPELDEGALWGIDVVAWGDEDGVGRITVKRLLSVTSIVLDGLELGLCRGCDIITEDGRTEALSTVVVKL